MKHMKNILLAMTWTVITASLAAAGQIHMLTWSDYIDPEIPKQFEKQTGVAVKIDVYEDTEAMMAKLQASGGESQYDLVVVTDHAIPVLAKLGLIRKLDLAKVPNAKNIEKRLVNPPFDPKGEYSLPYQWGTVGIIYNKKLSGFVPSWSMLLDPAKQPGKFLLLDSMRDTTGAALKLNGASVNAHKPDELKKAMETLLAAKQTSKCVGFTGSPSAAKQVVGGQADLAMVYNGDALNAMKEDKSNSCEYAVPNEGTIIWVDTMVITSKAPNADDAHRFIDYILDENVGAQLSNYINYASPNAAAIKHISETSRKDVRIYPTAEQLKRMEYLEDVGSDTGLYDEVWTAVKSR
jgi:spermidine/putrescine transport system substrate-binding protein